MDQDLKDKVSVNPDLFSVAEKLIEIEHLVVGVLKQVYH